MFQDITHLLNRLGLKENEAKVYLTCLHFKDGLYVHEIVKKIGFKRSSIDLILKRLVKKEYINKIKIGQRYKYMAEKPETILFMHENTLDDFKAIMPMLAKLGSNKTETEIRFFEGRDGIQKIYNDILLELKLLNPDAPERELISFSHGINVLNIFPDIQKKFIDKRIKMGVWYKAIIPKGQTMAPVYTTNKKAFRLIKAVDEKSFPFKDVFEIYGHSVMIYSPKKPYGGVVIRNKNIAASMRAIFYLMWDLLPEELY